MSTWWGLQYSEYVFGFLLNANYFLCLRPIAPPKEINMMKKLMLGFSTCFDSRRDIAAKNLPRFGKKNREYVPSRSKFLLNRSFVLAWTMSVFILIRRYPLSLWPDDFDSPKDRVFRRFLEVSSREWIILFYLSFGCWLESYCLLNSAHSLASIIAVTCGDEPKNWRPLFGDIGDAYTVGRFFGSVHVLNADEVLDNSDKWIEPSGISSCEKPL